MKKILMLLSVLALGACAEFDGDTSGGVIAESRDVIVTASTSDASRVAVADDWSVSWAENDDLLLYPISTPDVCAKLTMLEHGDHASSFSGTTTSASAYFRLVHPYPTEAISEVSGTTYSFDLAAQEAGLNSTYMVSSNTVTFPSEEPYTTSDVDMLHVGASILLNATFSNIPTGFTLNSVTLCDAVTAQSVELSQEVTGSFYGETTVGDIVVAVGEAVEASMAIKFNILPYTIAATDGITLKFAFTDSSAQEQIFTHEITLANDISFLRATYNTINASCDLSEFGGGLTDPDSEYEVFLLIGQSNMAGRGYMVDEEGVVIDNVYLLDTDGNVVEATSPINQYSTVNKGYDTQKINPGNGFAPVMEKYTGKKILLVSNARGGTSIGDWSKTSTELFNDVYQLYSEAVRRTLQAMEYGPLRAILWHQGESNSGSPGSYLTNLAAMVANLRTDLGISEDVPFIAGEIAPWHTNRDSFNPVICQIAGSVPNSDYVRTYGLTPLIDESDPHFDRESQYTLGERYAEKILNMVYGVETGGTLSTDAADNTLSFPYEGDTQTINISTSFPTSSIELILEYYDDSWCHVTQISDTEIQIQLDENKGTARETILTVRAGDGYVPEVMDIYINQDTAGGFYEVGDLVYDENEEPNGIVCYVSDDGTQVMALSFEVANVTWAYSGITTTEDVAMPSLYSDLNLLFGADQCFDYLKTFGYYETDGFYPAWQWARSLGDDWYLPSRTDWGVIMAAFQGNYDENIEAYDLETALNTKMVENGGTPYDNNEGATSIRYWSCNLASADAAAKVRNAKPCTPTTVSHSKTSGSVRARAVKYITVEIE